MQTNGSGDESDEGGSSAMKNSAILRGKIGVVFGAGAQSVRWPRSSPPKVR